ncbi:hypothetical protein PM082_013597 [Marasmius tenuissimus]|nr:hypothetical protein PM082_013597 [Marasmius tenuissimus]
MASFMSIYRLSRVSAIRSTANFLFTLFLYTKSDIKTTLIPIAIVGYVAAPVHSLQHAIEEFLWIWLHLLQFTTSNQSCSQTAVVEDAKNKPDRPIPSGRMSLTGTRILRWTLVPVCLIASYQFSTAVLAASVAVIAITVWYNEFHGGGTYWPIRNWLNGIGFGAFETGAVLLAGENRDQFDLVAARAILISTLLYATTTHTQDFKDVIGDRQIGRSTFPLDHPRVARVSVLVVLMAWSFFQSYVWDLDLVTMCAVCALALYVGLRFYLIRGMKDDQISFYWYNLWLSFAYAMPGWYRMNGILHH